LIYALFNDHDKSATTLAINISYLVQFLLLRFYYPRIFCVIAYCGDCVLATLDEGCVERECGIVIGAIDARDVPF
jgi:hypothetical protein